MPLLPVSSNRPRWVVELRPLSVLAMPLMMAMIGRLAIATTDMIMLGQLGPDAVVLTVTEGDVVPRILAGSVEGVRVGEPGPVAVGRGEQHPDMVARGDRHATDLDIHLGLAEQPAHRGRAELGDSADRKRADRFPEFRLGSPVAS